MALAQFADNDPGDLVRGLHNLLASVIGHVPDLKPGNDQATADANHAKLKAAVQQATTSGSGDGKVSLPVGVYRFGGTGTIYVDPSKCTIECSGSRLIANYHVFGSGDDAWFFTVRGTSGGTVGSQMRNAIRNFTYAGANSANDGFILFDTNTDTHNARMSIENFTVDQVGFAVGFGNRAYLMSFDKGRIKFNTAGVVTFPGMTDAGENCMFSKCSIGGGPICLQNDGAFDLRFDKCSFDFPTTSWIRNSSGANIICDDCHFEVTAANLTGVPFDIQGGNFLMKGGDILVTAGEAISADRFVNRGAGSNTRFRDVRIYGGKNSNVNGVFSVGTGQIETSFITGPVNALPPLIGNNPQDNLIGLSGSGEVDSPSKLAWNVYGDEPVTNRQNIYSLSVGLSNSVFLSGTQAIEFTRSFGNDAVARAFMPAPMDRMVGARTSIKAVPPAGQAAGAGLIVATLAAVQVVGYDQWQRPIIGETDNFVSQQVNIADLTQGFDWTTLSNFTPLKYVKKWATHMVFSLNLNQVPNGYKVYIDRLFVTPF